MQTLSRTYGWWKEQAGWRSLGRQAVARNRTREAQIAAWPKVKHENAQIVRDHRTTDSFAKWLAARGESKRSPSSLWSLARYIKRRKGHIAPSPLRPGQVTGQFTPRWARRLGLRAPRIPTWGTYAPLLYAEAHAALALATAADALAERARWYQASWIDVADQRQAAVDALARVEHWLLDLALGDDQTASTWFDERTDEEIAEDEQAMDDYVESLDYVAHGRYEEIIAHRLWGKPSGTDLLVEGPTDGDWVAIEEFTDAETNPVDIATSGNGHGIHMLIAAEQAPVAKRLRPGFGRAMKLLATVSDARRRQVDMLVWGEEGDPPTSESEERIWKVSDIGELRLQWKAARDAGDTATMRRIAFSGGLIEAAQREPRDRDALSVRQDAVIAGLHSDGMPEADASRAYTRETYPHISRERDFRLFVHLVPGRERAFAGPARLRIVYCGPKYAPRNEPYFTQPGHAVAPVKASTRRKLERLQVSADYRLLLVDHVPHQGLPRRLF